MAHIQQAANVDNPWPRFSWWFTAALLVVSVVLGFAVLGRYQQNGPALDFWTAICRAAGLTSESRSAGAPQPPLRTPTRIAWTRATLAQIGSGDAHRGAFIAMNCAACHGEHGDSASSLIPTLAGMDGTVIYKQLDDYRSGKRAWGVLSAIASALSPQDSADVAAYFAGRANGLRPVAGEPLPEGGRSLRQSVRSTRLVFAGDPERGIPPCSACHGPGAHKLGAPSLNGQRSEYIERQLAAFAQGIRQNDINQQMRVIAAQLAPDEMHEVALFYSAAGAPRTNEKLSAR